MRTTLCIRSLVSVSGLALDPVGRRLYFTNMGVHVSASFSPDLADENQAPSPEGLAVQEAPTAELGQEGGQLSEDGHDTAEKPSEELSEEVGAEVPDEEGVAWSRIEWVSLDRTQRYTVTTAVQKPRGIALDVEAG